MAKNDENPPEDKDTQNAPSDSDSDTSSDSEDYEETEIDAYLQAFRSLNSDEPIPDSELDPVRNYKDVMEALETSEEVKKMRERDDAIHIADRNPFDFPPDVEKWTEEDLRELWADGCNQIGGTGWDPAWAGKPEWKFVKNRIGKDPPIAPFYLPYRKPLPPIPDNHPDIKGPTGVIEELDRIEEFLKWVSYMFKDGSS